MEEAPQARRDDIARPIGGALSPIEEDGRPREPEPPPRRRLAAGFPIVTLVLILTNVAVHLLVANIAGVSPLYSAFIGGSGVDTQVAWAATLQVLGAKQNDLILGGEYWRMITSAFLHGGVVHLGLNMMALWSLGHFIEAAYGARRYLILYVGSVIGGSAGSLIGTDAPSVGASGAIFGLLGVGLVFSLRYRKHIPKGAGMALFRQLLFWTVLMLVIGFMVSVIDNSGHIGGLVAGIFLALLLSSHVAPGSSALERGIASVGFLAAALALIGGLGFLCWNAHQARPISIRNDTTLPLSRYDSPAGYSLRRPADWKGTSAGMELLQFKDGEGRYPLLVRIKAGGEELRSGGPDDVLRRIEKERGDAKPISRPEPYRHRVGDGYRVQVKVIRGETVKETRYYFARGNLVLVLIFRDAIVSEDLREAIVMSLQWRGG